MKFKIEKKKVVPFDFVLEALIERSPYTKPMFGCTGVYVGDKIVFILRDRKSPPEDDGVWMCTSTEHHDSLRKIFPNMRSIQVFETPVTGWQVLGSDQENFEEMVGTACELVLRNDPRIGRAPTSKRKPSAKKVKTKRQGSKKSKAR